jgi:hypothetical protein
MQWSGHEAFGTIVWQREEFYGIEFDEPVRGAVLVATRQMQDVGGMTGDEIAQWTAKTGWDYGKAID